MSISYNHNRVEQNKKRYNVKEKPKNTAADYIRVFLARVFLLGMLGALGYLIYQIVTVYT